MQHLRIHPDNIPLLDLPQDHPARRAIVLHAECSDSCVGREIVWPGSTIAPIDQTWYSLIDRRKWKFSGFAYAFVSFDLILDGWINADQGLQPFEKSFLIELPRLRGLLEECEAAAKAESNIRVLPLINKVRDFFDVFFESIVVRVGHVEIDASQKAGESLWSDGR